MEGLVTVVSETRETVEIVVVFTLGAARLKARKRFLLFFVQKIQTLILDSPVGFLAVHKPLGQLNAKTETANRTRVKERVTPSRNQKKNLQWQCVQQVFSISLFIFRAKTHSRKSS